MDKQCIINCIRKNIVEEQKAIINYDELICACKDVVPYLIPLLTDIRNEEILHTGQLQSALDKLFPENEEHFINGLHEGDSQL